MVRAFDLRCARYLGLDKTHLQMVQTAVAINKYRVFNGVVELPALERACLISPVSRQLLPSFQEHDGRNG